MNFNPLPYLARIHTGGNDREGLIRLAILISPTHALTTVDAIAQPELSILDLPDNPSVGSINVAALDFVASDADFAIVRLARPVELGGRLTISAEMPDLDSHWTSHVFSLPRAGREGEFHEVSGRVERRTFFQAAGDYGIPGEPNEAAAREQAARRTVIRLAVDSEPDVPYDPGGAAVFVDGELVAMVSSTPPNDGRWLAIPIAAMIEGPDGGQIQRLLGVNAARPSEKTAPSSKPFATSSGDLDGTVMDSSGAFIPGALVSLTNSSGDLHHKTTSNEQGQFEFPPIPTDVYSIEVEAPGFQKFEQKGLVVSPFRRVRFEARLSLASAEEIPAGPADLDFDAFYKRLSPGSMRALSHAAGLRNVWRNEEIRIEHLVGGLFENERGPTRRLFRKYRIDRPKLVALLEESANSGLPSDYSAPTLTQLPAVSPDVKEALRIARDAADGIGSPEIQTRHLLLGVLSIDQTKLVELLKAQGVRPDDELLSDLPADAKVPKSIVYINADNPEGKDLLDIKADVAALSAVIAAREVPTPFSIGLFGDWGSGKSFFMDKMRQEIRDLKKLARQHTGASAYCENIVQIEFNAWSYMDTDLWASLVTEIFEGLANEIETDANLRRGTDPATAKARLLAATASARDVVAQEERKRDSAKDELQAIERHLEGLKKTREARLAPATILSEVYNAVVTDKEIKDQIDKTAEQLNITKAKGSADELKAQMLGVNGYWSALKLELKRGDVKIKWLLAAAALALIVVSPFIVPQSIKDKLGEGIAKVAALFSSTAAVLALVAAQARRVLKIIQNFKSSYNQRIAEARKKAVDAQEKDRDELDSKVAAAEQRIKDAKKEVQDLELALEAMRADKKLLDFIGKRNASTDYTSRLGTIAKARRDFKQLSDLLEEARKERNSPEDKKSKGQQAGLEMPQIDRIVLYIDDLDRCAEDKVVKVLEAVHLLLAFKLFVVIVAVDSRWLLHSLKKHSAAFQASLDGDSGISDEEITHWESTPMNYLEKIFQIPFYLRPMRGSGFKAIVNEAAGAFGRSTSYRDSLLAPGSVIRPDRPGSQEPPPLPAGGNAPEAAERTDATQQVRADSTPARLQTNDPARAKAATEVDSQPPSPGADSIAAEDQQPEAASADQQSSDAEAAASAGANDSDSEKRTATSQRESNPTALHIESWEFAFMKKLHRLISSPRAAKRFINIYRLMRVSITDDQELEAFIGNAREGEHRSALLLLAILTGYPSEATDILRDLIEEDTPATWWNYVDSCKDRVDGNTKSTTSTQSLKRIEQQRWRELIDRLQDLRGVIPEAEPRDSFRKWAPKVARYSFQSGRVVAAQLDDLVED